MQPTPAVEVHDLSYSYGDRRALDGFSLSVPAGSVFGLLGPNGSGKSTFVTMLAAMAPPASGSLSAFGQPPHSALRARIGTVFQENASDPMMTVSELLRLAGRLFGVPRAALEPRIRELLAQFGLSDRAGELTGNLSGGMRRRLEMCRALLHNPELLLLDEPTTGVDPDERRALWDALLRRDTGQRTVVLATNDLAEADAVCDLVAFIQAGRVIATGTPAALKQGLRHESVRVGWESPTAEQLRMVAEWAGGSEVTRDGGFVRITVDDASTFVPRLFTLAPGAIRSVTIEKASLEDAYFRHVTRRGDAMAGMP
ncbi:MAG: hypothetical protein C0506_06765 [Anaerolinea sp.]|nr:hypothetical protein [Anaerolinea sp.]